MTTTAKQAQATEIFFVESTFRKGKLVDFKVEGDNLYDFVMKSQTLGETGSLFVKENEEEETFEVRRFGFRGNGSKVITTFETEEEAEDYVFNSVYDYDFYKDDQRDTQYFYTEEDAEECMIERISESWNLDKDVVKSYLRHLEIVTNAKNERRIKAETERLAAKKEYEAKKEVGVKEEVSKLIPFCSQFKTQYSEISKLSGMDKNNACAKLMKDIIEVSGIGKVHYFWEDFRCLTHFLK